MDYLTRIKQYHSRYHREVYENGEKIEISSWQPNKWHVSQFEQDRPHIRRRIPPNVFQAHSKDITRIIDVPASLIECYLRCSRRISESGVSRIYAYSIDIQSINIPDIDDFVVVGSRHFAVITTTYGSDGWIEIFNLEGQHLASAYWGGQKVDWDESLSLQGLLSQNKAQRVLPFSIPPFEYISSLPVQKKRSLPLERDQNGGYILLAQVWDEIEASAQA